MKKFIMLGLVAMLSGLGLHAQTQSPNSYLSGTITDTQGNPISNLPVNISYYDWNLGFFSLIDTTDNNGFYSEEFYLQAGNFYIVYVSFASCNGMWQRDSLHYSAFSNQSLDFVYCGTPSFSQCDANFIYNDNGNGSFFFDNTSFSWTYSNNFAINWDFGDGNTGTGDQIYHTYATADTFEVCMTYFDSISSCSDTQCYFLINSMQNSTCEANFFRNRILSVAGKYIFRDNSTLPLDSVTYIMDYGDGSRDTTISAFPSNPNFSHIYDVQGVVNTCLTVISNAGCRDTLCDTLNIPISCLSDFGIRTDGVGNFTFMPLHIGPAPISYFWDFGDGATSTLQSPTHYYPVGSYTATLITETAYGCKDTMVHQFFTTRRNPGDAKIYGFAYISDTSTRVTFGTAYLIQSDTVNGQAVLNLVDSLDIWACTFSFDSVMPGNYFVKVALKPGSQYYASNLPTYFTNSLYWSSADTVKVDLLDEAVRVILVPGVNPGGPGFVGGLVSQGANKRQGAGLGGIQVNLFKQDGTPVTVTYTDGSGRYEFDNLAYGDYRIHVEMLGVSSEDIELSLSPGKPSVDDNDFEVNGQEVSIVTSLESIFLEGGIILAPNPVKDKLNLRIGLKKAGQANFQITDLLGKTYYKSKNYMLAGNQEMQFRLEDLPSGVYMISMEMDGEIIYAKFAVNK
ncbi:MAG: PKD domain-containing protein [Bacteroidia bacterium]|nr:PKD domain-containing protein [Bacteroidia bacterium]